MDEKTILMKLLSIFIMDGMSITALPIKTCLIFLERNHDVEQNAALDTARNYEDIQVLEEDLLSFIPKELAFFIANSRTKFLDEYIKSICERIIKDNKESKDDLLELEEN
jgi:hypothetical protein